MTPRIDRRALLVAGLAGTATACSGTSTPKGDSSPSSPTSPASSTAPVSQPPTAAEWDKLARSISGSLARPDSSSYDVVRLVQNPRFDSARPLAVLSAKSSRDVATGLAFVQDQGLPVAVRSGGHSYPGWSAGNKALVIDVRPMNRITLDGTSATIGAGTPLVDVYSTLGQQGRGIAAGSCPTVGIAGLSQGGGVGVLTREHGLTCDAVTAMEVVLADGRVVTADKDTEPDLYWALRGGGGGHLGVVTSFTTDTFQAPTITRAYLAWPLSAAQDVVPAWLAAMPKADRKLWSTLKLLGGATHTSGPVMFVSATWTGSPSAMDAALQPLLGSVPAPTTDSRNTQSMVDTMLSFAGCSSIPVAQCHTGPGGSLQREAFAATSHIITGQDADVDAMLDRVEAAQGSGLTEAGLSLDSLGGAVDDLGATDTAFGHRGAVASVQYTATYAGGPAATAASYVRGFRRAMTPSWGTGAYVNYADARMSDYMANYFADNADRLAQLKEAYDPHGLFTQPQDYEQE